MGVDQIFDAHHYSEEKKVQLAGIEFTGYALIWWNQICCSRYRPTTWRGMKEFMRRRFVPEHYRRDMYNKLRRLSQGNMSVDEYYKEMELLMIRTGTTEDPEATMACFFNGLNIEVQDRVEMVLYYNIQDLVHQAVRAEQQIKRCQVGTIPGNTCRRSQHKVDDVSPSSRTTTSNRPHGSASDEEAVFDTSSEKLKDAENVVASFEAAESYPSLMVQRLQEDRIEDKGQRWNIFTNCKLSARSTTRIVS